MFGRDLNQQLIADGAPVPVIITKCIDAVEAQGMLLGFNRLRP